MGHNTVQYPRFMLAAPSSGSGKTLITCGLLQALKDRGLKVSSFKCGPDYIDPMFHRQVLNTRSANLDTFFTDDETTRYLLRRHASGSDLSVIEGVMGYYDGLGGTSDRASSFDVARATGTPVVLIVDARGMSLSAAAMIRGFVHFRKESRIRGIILNQVSPGLYPRLKEAIEQEQESGSEVRILGFVPRLDNLQLQSRHLGLVMPDEVKGLREKLCLFARQLENTIDLDALIDLAHEAEDGPFFSGAGNECIIEDEQALKDEGANSGRRIRIALAQDEAFCFSYTENLDLLQQMGAELVPFSPLRDRRLPPDIQGLLLYGGYPELYAEKLAENEDMRHEVSAAVKRGLPVMAECGGFLYLMEEMEDLSGRVFPMTGVLHGRSFRTGKLGRFGYISLNLKETRDAEQMWDVEKAQGVKETKYAASAAAVSQTPESAFREPVQILRQSSFGNEDGKLLTLEQYLRRDILDEMRGHEFHYYDTTDNGSACTAFKKMSGQAWACMHLKDNLFAGFPHLYYYANPKLPECFLRACADYKTQIISAVSHQKQRM